MFRAGHVAEIAKHPHAQRTRSLFDRKTFGTTPLACVDERALPVCARCFELSADRDELPPKLATPIDRRLSFGIFHGSPARTTPSRRRLFYDVFCKLFDRLFDLLRLMTLLAPLFEAFVEFQKAVHGIAQFARLVAGEEDELVAEIELHLPPRDRFQHDLAVRAALEPGEARNLSGKFFVMILACHGRPP
jgi:hypothetical protein